jgi:hypothetical protein
MPAAPTVPAAPFSMPAAPAVHAAPSSMPAAPAVHAAPSSMPAAPAAPHGMSAAAPAAPCHMSTAAPAGLHASRAHASALPLACCLPGLLQHQRHQNERDQEHDRALPGRGGRHGGHRHHSSHPHRLGAPHHQQREPHPPSPAQPSPTHPAPLPSPAPQPRPAQPFFTPSCLGLRLGAATCGGIGVGAWLAGCLLLAGKAGCMMEAVVCGQRPKRLRKLRSRLCHRSTAVFAAVRGVASATSVFSAVQRTAPAGALCPQGISGMHRGRYQGSAVAHSQSQ